MFTSLTQDKFNTTLPLNTVEKRKETYTLDSMWDMLNPSQQYAVCSLGQFGYLLTYVRSFAGNSLAILKQNDKLATINAAGVININPAITCRE